MSVRSLAALSLIVCSMALAADGFAASADMRIQGLGGGYVHPGQSTSIFVYIQNFGPATATNVAVNIPLPAGLTLANVQSSSFDNCAMVGSAVRCTVASITPAVATKSALLWFAVGSNVPNGTKLFFNGTVTADQDDPLPANNVGPGLIIAAAPTDLVVTKNIVPGFAPGGVVTVRLTWSNNGPNEALNPGLRVYVSGGGYPDLYVKSAKYVSGINAAISIYPDQRTAQFVPTTLLPGQSLTVEVTLQTWTLGPFDLTVYSFMQNADSNDSNSFYNIHMAGSLNVADLGVAAGAPPTVKAGDDLPFSVNVASKGPADAQGVAINWSVPAGTSFVSVSQTAFQCTSLSPGATSGTISCTGGLAKANGAAIAVTFHVKAAPSTVSVTNKATITATTPIANPYDDIAVATTSIIAGTAPDVSLRITPNVSRVGAGERLVYAVNLTEAGADASNTVVTITPPSGFVVSSVQPAANCSVSGTVLCTIPSLLNGATAAITITGSAPTAPGTYVAIAEAQLANDSDPANNHASATVEVTPPASALIVSMNGASKVSRGSELPYTINVRNSSASDLHNVVISAHAAEYATIRSVNFAASGSGMSCNGTRCTIATLGPSVSASVNVLAGIAAAAPVDSLATFTVDVTSSDAGPASGRLLVSITGGPTDLALTLTAPPAVTTSAPLPFHITVQNAGSEEAKQLAVSTTLPAGVTFVSSPACAMEAGAVVCRADALAEGATVAFELIVTAPKTPGAVTVQATVTNALTDTNAANDTASATVSVVAPRRRAR